MSKIITKFISPEEEIAAWKDLNELATAISSGKFGKAGVARFYREYADYLKGRNIISPGRESLYNMAVKAYEVIEQYDHEEDKRCC